MCCSRAEQEWPVVVPPRGDAVLRFHVIVHELGDFEQPIRLLAADAGALRILPVVVRGRGIEASAAARP